MEKTKEEAIQVRIFQMSDDERNRAWISVQELRDAGLQPDAGRYRQVLETQMMPSESMADLYDRLHFGCPEDGTHRLQVSDVIMLDRGGEIQSYYVDPFGFKSVPEMTVPLLEYNRTIMQQQMHKRAGR